MYPTIRTKPLPGYRPQIGGVTYPRPYVEYKPHDGWYMWLHGARNASLTSHPISNTILWDTACILKLRESLHRTDPQRKLIGLGLQEPPVVIYTSASTSGLWFFMMINCCYTVLVSLCSWAPPVSSYAMKLTTGSSPTLWDRINIDFAIWLVKGYEPTYVWISASFRELGFCQKFSP